MSIDRELLELAAKAAGYKLEKFISAVFPYPTVYTVNGQRWNPLTDDGDALRLAVKLGIVIDTTDGVNVQYIVGSVAYPITAYEFDDIYAATRRAIVRAAAEIGRQMQKVGAA